MSKWRGIAMKQITIVVDDKVGLLADISYLLGRSHINIEGISVAMVGGKSIVTLTVKDSSRAIEVLAANGYRCLEADSLVAKLDNKAGELAKMSRLLADNKVNIENVTMLSQDEHFSVYSLRVDKPGRAEKVLAPYLSAETN